MVDPCIPANWERFSVTRRFRNATYQITVNNPAHLCRGVRSLRLDGREIAGQIIPILDDGGIHQVDVTLEAQVGNRTPAGDASNSAIQNIKPS
jgi:cellobiose phosphorylase